MILQCCGNRISHLFWSAYKEWTAHLKTIRLQTAHDHEAYLGIPNLTPQRPKDMDRLVPQPDKLPEVLSLPNFKAPPCSITTLTKLQKFLLRAQELASENEEKKGGYLDPISQIWSICMQLFRGGWSLLGVLFFFLSYFSLPLLQQGDSLAHGHPRKWYYRENSVSGNLLPL